MYAHVTTQLARFAVDLSKCGAGREMLGSGGHEERDPNGENEGPLHRDDSTFGEYMAALTSRSSSGNGFRRVNSSGTLFRLPPIAAALA